MQLQEEFRNLADLLEQLLSLLDESGDEFWSAYLRRGLTKVKNSELAGATYILGCFNGADTFADLTIGSQWQQEDPIRYRNLNARLMDLRNRTFQSASRIASRRLW